MSVLSERAVLMRLSKGLPGQHRTDKRTTAEVKMTKGLGEGAGDWVTHLWPKDCMKDIKRKLTEADKYHRKRTFPFGSTDQDEAETPAGDVKEEGGKKTVTGIRLLPAAFIAEYGDTMRKYRSELEGLVEQWLQCPEDYVNWARREHNGTFDADNYPGCSLDAMGGFTFDADEFRKVMRKKFYLRNEPLPVPDKEQFTANLTALLGTDVDSVNLRVQDATQEAQRELMRRMIQPVSHMAHRLAGKACPCSECNGKQSKKDHFKDTLIGNIQEIIDLGPGLNICGDASIDQFLKEMTGLTLYAPEALRNDDSLRKEAAAKAQATLERLSGYKL